MEMIQLEIKDKDQAVMEESYEKPTVTTFGSVAKLTLAGRGSVSDFFFGRQKRHHHTGF